MNATPHHTTPSPQTCKGRVLYLLGYFFSAYCGYKMFMATVNFVFSRDPNQDPVTKFLTLAVRSLSLRDSRLYLFWIEWMDGWMDG